MKNLRSIRFGILSMFILTGCGSIGNESQIEEQEKKNNHTESVSQKDTSNSSLEEKNLVDNNKEISVDNATIIETQASFVVKYENARELVDDSEIAVEGVVVSTENYVHIDKETAQGYPYTKLTFKINQVLNGDPSLEGSEILILEEGGYITAEQDGMDEKFPDLTEEELKETYLITLNGHKPSSKGDEMVAFLNGYGKSETDFKTNFDYYSFIGAYQAKFDYDKKSSKYMRPAENFDVMLKQARTKADKSFVEEEVEVEEGINEEVTKLVNEAR
ncbi:hypothetical protein [Niallia taxi]|uniref:Lipoprotein n=1 Tax=Niallia taxi TaxID=2499688 RepID=A0A3S2W7F9_9BACI|nr:hypothetical protein [Niallia taxi]RVT67789.1 hypothetical protein EM808_04765 [Niallia taxi]